jgi:hypothetical protein
MKIDLPLFDDESQDAAVSSIVQKLQRAMSALERALARIRVDGTLIIGGGREITKHFSATVVWDPPNLNDATQTTKDVTVTGVRLADNNTVTCGFTESLQGMLMTAYVSADDTVTAVLRNQTGGALNLASGNLTADVWKH